MFSLRYKQKITGFTALLFVLFCLVDPNNAVFGLKMPAFLLFILSLAVSYKPNFKYVGIILSLILVTQISVFLGYIGGIPADAQIQLQYSSFFILLITLLWSEHIDLYFPLSFAGFVLSILSILGFMAMLYNPEIEEALYLFSLSHDQPFFMGHRTFLGVDFTSFVFMSLPPVFIPAAIHYEKLLYEKKNRRWNLLLTIVYFFAFFCSGQRAMFLGVFAILVVIAYPKIKRNKIIQLLLIIIFVIGIYIAYMAIVDPDSKSTNVKFGHIESYFDLFQSHWEYLIFGMGPGAYFYSKGFGVMTPLTEWTYIEIIRMYGFVGLFFFVCLLIMPLVRHNNKKNPIKYWQSIVLGYIVFLISCMSDPWLIGSPGLICILFIYSVVDNPKYKIEKIQ